MVSLRLLLTLAVLAASSHATTASTATDAAVTPSHARILHGVHRQLQREGRANIVVTMRTPPHRALESDDTPSDASRGERISRMVERLEALAANSQRGIDQHLAHEATLTQELLFEQQHRSWILNARYFQGATLEWVEALAAFPDVAEIREEETFEMDEGMQFVSAAGTNASSVQWGIARIRASELWARGVTGKGVVVGSIDSGVRATHQLLRSTWRRAYGWFSPGERSSEPTDRNGHGTHTVGTMVGAGGVGVAPDAQWIACQACLTTCTEAAIVQCTEWMLCPSDPSGQNKDCSQAPHVINNSWSTRSGKTTHQPILDAWLAAGIVPVFSNGNAGPTCGSVGSPGEQENVISVGNVAANGSLARLSSRGPSPTGTIKPDLSAPGQLIASASYLNDDDLRVLSGTSMAAPHVAGAVALLLSAMPGLSVAALRHALTSSADRVNVGVVDASCSAVGSWPNNDYGHGVLDAYAAFERLSASSSVPSSPPTAAPSPSCPLEQDIDLLGNDIGSAASAHATDCCSRCLEVAGCRAFTWSRYNGGTCWFKSRADGPRSAVVGVQSAAVDRDSDAMCTVSKDTDFAGNDLTSVAATRPSACCSLCAERRSQGCRAYTWSSYQGGTCWLKTAHGASPTSSSGTVSGEIVYSTL